MSEIGRLWKNEDARFHQTAANLKQCGFVDDHIGKGA
jgi:hypothetical protein